MSELYKGYKIAIEYDTDAECPNDWGSYQIVPNSEDYYTATGKLKPEYQAKIRAGKMFAVDKFEHGNVAYGLAGSFTDRWDTSRGWGWIIFEDEYVKGTTFDERKGYAEGDLETYTDWANGNVYGYIITDPYGDEPEDSACWGFYGYDDVLAEAKRTIDHLISTDKPAMHAVSARSLHR